MVPLMLEAEPAQSDSQISFAQVALGPGHARKSRARRRLKRPSPYDTYPAPVPLTRPQECALIRQAQQGDLAARNLIWTQHLKLIESVAHSFYIPDSLLPDAIQEGLLGLKRAIEKFDSQYQHSFADYAWRWVYLYIRRFLEANWLFLHIPTELYAARREFQREVNQGITPTEQQQISERWSQQHPVQFQGLLRLDRMLQSIQLQDLDRKSSPLVREDDSLEQTEWPEICRQAFRGLSKRDQLILTKRYGLFGEMVQTLAQIGKKLKLCGERVRQMQVKAESRLRRQLEPVRDLITQKEPVKPA